MHRFAGTQKAIDRLREQELVWLSRTGNVTFGNHT
jgi:hypothetical protein